MKFYKKDVIYSYLFYAVLFVLCFWVINWYNTDTIFNNDDVFLIKIVREALSQRYTGCYLFKVNYFLFYELPKIFHVHPNDFFPLVNFIRALLIFFISIAAADFICIKKYNHYQYAAITAAFISFIFLIYQGIINFQKLSDTYSIIRYLIPLLLMILVFNFVSKNIIMHSGFNKKYSLLSFICIPFMQNNTEIFTADLCLFLFLTAVYSCFRFKKIPPAVYIPSIAAVINCILYIRNGMSLYTDKSASAIQDVNILNFLEIYYSYVVKEHFFILIPLIVMIIFYISRLLYKKYKDLQDLDFLFMSLIILAANVMPLFLLINFSADLYFQIDLKIVYSVLYFLSIFMMINLLLLNIEKGSCINKFTTVFIIFAALASYFSYLYGQKEEISKNISSYRNNMHEYKKRVYQYTKFFRFCTLKDIMPKIYLDKKDNDDFGFGVKLDSDSDYNEYDDPDNHEGECFIIMDENYYNTKFPIFNKITSDLTKDSVPYFMPILAIINETVNIDAVYKKGFCFVSKKEAENELKNISGGGGFLYC